MEMTPGQIMEAEISATLLEDDEVTGGGGQIPSSSSTIKPARSSRDDDLESDTLPENLFTQDQPTSPMLNRPPVITEEPEDVDEAIGQVVNKRKRPLSGTLVAVGGTQVPGSTALPEDSLGKRARTSGSRQRNLSSQKGNTNSSSASAKTVGISDSSQPRSIKQ